MIFLKVSEIKKKKINIKKKFNLNLNLKLKIEKNIYFFEKK
jgi:hypothetical protein